MATDESNDTSRLIRALNKTDQETRDFLLPLITVPAVQTVLLCFLNDKSKTFSEWVWQPQNRQILENLKCHLSNAVQPEKAAINNEFQNLISRKAIDPKTLLEKAEDQKTLGQTNFKKGLFFAAMRCYEKAINHIEEYYMKDEKMDKEEKINEVNKMFVSCCCNVALAAFKESRYSTMREYASKAISKDPLSIKAYYLRSKCSLKESMYFEALEDVSMGLKLAPENKELLNLQLLINKTKDRIPEPINPVSVLNEVPILPTEKRKRVRLPSKEITGKEIHRLNQYIASSCINIYPAFDDELINSEPIFHCHYLLDGKAIAVGTATSKKKAQAIAAQLVITHLHELYPEDADLPIEESKTKKYNFDPVIERQPWKGIGDKISRKAYEKSTNPVALLDILLAQKVLKSLEFEFENHSILTAEEDIPLFVCKVKVNGNEMASGSARSKRLAKNEACKSIVNEIIQFDADLEFQNETEEKH